MSRALLCVLSVLTAACGSTANSGPVATQSGAALFESRGCVECHGSDGRGVWLGLGPSLEGAAQYWSPETLATYLIDPEAYSASDPRLGDRDMPGYATLGEAERLRLSRYVIELSSVP